MTGMCARVCGQLLTCLSWRLTSIAVKTPGLFVYDKGEEEVYYEHGNIIPFWNELQEG